MSSRPREHPLLEREGELAVLAACAGAAAAGAGRLLVVEGVAGVGKTRLLGQARTAAAENGLRVLSARAGELERDFPFGVVRQLFEGPLAGAGERDREAAFAGPARLAAPLLVGTPAEPAGDGERLFAILHGLYWLTANLAAAGPLMLLVDDVQWCDAPSLRFLAYLVRRLDGMPVGVTCTHRSAEGDADDPLVGEIVADAGAVVLRPAALSREAARALLRSRLAPDAENGFCDACFEAVGGTPLLLVELAYRLAAERIEPLDANVALLRRVAPEAVSRSVLVRLRRLSPEASQLARAAAVLGGDASLRDVCAVAALDGRRAGDAATELTRAGILAGGEAEFSHPAVRQAVYGDVPLGERSALHHRAARALADSGAPVERVAAQLVLTLPAGDGWAVDMLREAASRALASGASDAAVRYLRRALDEPPERRTDVLCELGLAERRVDTAAAVIHLAQAAADVDDPPRRAEIDLERARGLWHLDREEEAVHVLREAIERLGSSDVDLRRRMEAELIGSALWQPALLPLAEARIAAVDTDALGGGVGSDLLLACIAHHRVREGRDREGALGLARRALATGRLEREGAVGINYAAVVLFIGGAYDESLAALERARELGRRRGDVFAVADADMFRGSVYAELGDLRRAERDLQTALDAGLHLGLMRARPAGMLASVLVERGSLAEARAAIDALWLPPRGRESGHLLFYLLGRARVLAAEARMEEGLRDIEAAGRLAAALHSQNPSHVPWRVQAAEALIALGRADEAVALAEDDLGRARLWGVPRAISSALRVLGLATGGGEGERLLREAAAELEGTPVRLERARALVDLGAHLRRANRRAEARAVLADGVLLAQDCGARALVRRGTEELAAAGAKPRRPLATGLDSLTASERRVAELAAAGHSNREIAQTLFVTTKTVEVHLSSAYRKLGIRSRAQLVEHLPPEPAQV